MALSVSVLTGACSILGLGASAACERAAAQWDSHPTVAAAFSTTVGRVWGMMPSENGVVASGAKDGTRAYLCYLDGEIPKAPPPANGVVQPSFDRSVVVVTDEHAVLVMAGYRDRVPILDPN